MDGVILRSLDNFVVPKDMSHPVRSEMETIRRRLNQEMSPHHLTGRAVIWMMNKDLAIGSQERQRTDKWMLHGVHLGKNQDAVRFLNEWNHMEASLLNQPSEGDALWLFTAQLDRLGGSHP